jgi:hypothetical protein
MRGPLWAVAIPCWRSRSRQFASSQLRRLNTEGLGVARNSLNDFPKVTPNDLRHTAASLAVSAGGNVLALARMLGHEDPSLTLRTYTDLFDSDLDALADVLDQHRTAALQPSTANIDREPEEEKRTRYVAANGLTSLTSLLPGTLGRGGGI